MPAIRWVSQTEERLERAFEDFALRHGVVPSLQLLALCAAAPVVLIAEDTADAILAQLSASSREQGGLLLGRVYALEPVRGPAVRGSVGNAAGEAADSAPPAWLTAVEVHVPSVEGRSSTVSLRMEPALWRQATPLLDAGMTVVGWYHSHPDLGAFFSGTDRSTQRSFFRKPWSLGLVVDPVRGELATFAGPAAADYPASLLRWPSLAPFSATPGTARAEAGAG